MPTDVPRPRATLRAALWALALVLAPALQAAEIRDGGRLAYLELPPGKGLSDGVVLMTHGTLAHGRMEIMRTLQGLLKEQGIASLAITLTLGQPDRRGMYDCDTPHTHKHTDALAEIGAWLDWLQAQGGEEVVLLGHSRGGNQTAWFAAEHDRPAVKAVVLIAPMTWEGGEARAAAYQKRWGTALAPRYEQARRLVEAGEGATTMKGVDFIYCGDAEASAEAFADYYAPEPRFDTPALLPQITKPVLVVAGSDDKVVEGLIDKVEPHTDGESVRLRVIDGADHFFRDLYADEVVEAMMEFFGEL